MALTVQGQSNVQERKLQTNNNSGVKSSTATNALSNNLSTGNVSGTSNTQATQDVNTSQQVTDSPAIKNAKLSCEEEFNSMKKVGIAVSGWGQNNTCQLSKDGHKATISIDKTGKISNDGDMQYMMETLKSDPKEKASVDNQSQSLKKFTDDGWSVKSDPRLTMLNGKSALKYVLTKGGQTRELYLGNDGKEIK